MTQLHFWAEIVGGLGTEGSRLPTPQEQARRRQLIDLGYWPAWMEDTVNMSLSAMGERFECTTRRSSMRGTPILSSSAREGGTRVLDVASD